MMKKLLVLTAVTALTAGTVGCECCNWFRRGANLPLATTVVPETVCDPCYTVNPCDPCDPCAPPALCDPGAPGAYTTTPTTVLPGPGPATTAPAQ
jgi:hypothetical protein